MKNIRGIIHTIFFCYCILFQPFGHTEAKSNINPYTLFDELASESQLVNILGEGCTTIEQVRGEIIKKSHAYYIPGEEIWIEFQLSHVLDKNLNPFISEVILSKKNLCEMMAKPKRSFDSIDIPKGIKIGDSQDKVVKLYGNPTVTISINGNQNYSSIFDGYSFNHGTVFRYFPESLSEDKNKSIFYEFYFENNFLHTILISNE